MPLVAINSRNKYVHVDNYNKNDKYKCPGCKSQVVYIDEYSKNNQV